MRKSASWAPAPNLKVLAVERNETDWIVAVDGLDHGTCPVCRLQSISRHSSYRRTLQDLSAQGKPVSVRVRMTRWGLVTLSAALPFSAFSRSHR